MIIQVDRYKSSDQWTLSKVSIDGRYECVGLEDEKREKKVMHETRIPEGTYKITLRTFGGHHERYKKKFPEHKGMLWVRDVPRFQDILIHIGNTETDTSGCLLLGSKADEKNGTISGSTIAYRKFYKKVLTALQADEEVIIEYKTT
jgi:hypothetical protein